MIPVRFTNGQRQVAEQKDVAEREKLEGEANDINYSQSLGLKYPKNSRICSWTEAPLVGPDTKCLCLNKGFYPSPARALCSDRSTESSTLSLSLSLTSFFSSFFSVFSLSPFVRDTSVLLFSRYFKFYLAYWTDNAANQSSRLFPVHYRQHTLQIHLRAYYVRRRKRLRDVDLIFYIVN